MSETIATRPGDAPEPGERPARKGGPRAVPADALHAASAVVGVLIMALGALGLGMSYLAVSDYFRPSFGVWSWCVPIGTDIAIVAFSAGAILFALYGIPIRWIRVVPWSLTAATVWFNAADAHTWPERGAHALMPALWVLAVEVCDTAIRYRMDLVDGTRMDRIRRSRWLLAPISTARLWRRMVLWEENSYTVAIGREHERGASVALLRQWYGRGWRVAGRAPRAERLAVRLQGVTAEPVAELLERSKAGVLAAAAAVRRPAPQAPQAPPEAPAIEPAAAAGPVVYPAAERIVLGPRTPFTAQLARFWPEVKALPCEEPGADAENDGENGENATLDQAAEARRLRVEEGLSYSKIARRMGHGKSWAHGAVKKANGHVV
jgi:Protein of unknown function (DUF2637)